jgi:hypothetical protein
MGVSLHKDCDASRRVNELTSMAPSLPAFERLPTAAIPYEEVVVGKTCEVL